MHIKIISNLKEVVIIGGGLAGLSTAVQAIQRGLRPIILEKNRHLGGRVRSFVAPDVQRPLDNGQHVISAAYQHTLRYLEKIGSLNQVEFQRHFETNFIESPDRRFRFRSYPLPAPLHFLIPLLLNRSISGVRWADFWKLIFRTRRIPEEKFRRMSVDEWATTCNLSPDIRRYLFTPLSLAVLNTAPGKASALLLKSAIEQSFFHSGRMARLGLLKNWLSEIFVKPAEEFITTNGGSIYKLTGVAKLVAENDSITRVITRKQSFDSPWVVAALPPYSLAQILQNSALKQLAPLKNGLKKFKYNPILTINLFLEKPLPGSFPLSPVGSPIQWIFPHPNFGEANDFGYALVISDAAEWSALPAEEIMAVSVNEINHLLGINLEKEGSLLKSKVLKEKRATILQDPESMELRPGSRTPLANFFLAGDWTGTALPATIEGAVLSGKLAMDEIAQKL